MSIMNELKYEITRLARKEIKKELEPIKRVNAAQRSLIANLRRDVTELQRELARLQRELGKEAPPAKTDKKEESKGFWISGKGVQTLRKKLMLTQAEMAKLAGVSTQSVVKWEKYPGKIPFRRKATPGRMQEIRNLSKTKAWAELGKK